ncbi:hypothetical protein K1T71_006554 [Dendrolimus kikuchii]|uniref:Uncharacterized protein n=1 Tax=Dendrolimus kikuchii TaxID=765133 RepID=A0ACC1D1G6_9NEOP|nr:hypothetical protein K1T71_006554 [Dendrolimus kikuchii]
MAQLVWLLVAALASVEKTVDAVVGGQPASAPEPDAAVVFVQKYGSSARVEGLKDDKIGYYSFFGMRYADPPVDRRRFQRPVRRYLAGELNQTQHCAPCPQRDPYNHQRVIGSEDCLCLNVYAPKMPGEEEGCPVIFYIHGGNYRSGSTASYGGQHLAQKDTILVTVQYRLGALGFLSTAQKDASGNVGIFDLKAAETWVYDYIQFFGGDPNRVVFMGQGSGGSAASMLAMANVHQGRSATGVVALSGTPLSPGAVRPEPEKHAEMLAERTGCPKSPAEKLVMCLRELSVEKLILADADIDINAMDTSAFLSEISGRSGPGVRVEGKDDLRALPPIVSEQPVESLKKKEKRPPILTGVTSAETSKAVFGKYNKFLSDQLQNVKNFIQNDIVGGLQNVISDIQSLLPVDTSAVDGILPIKSYYETLFNNTFNVVDGLAQIAEATGDALFNFPAYETVQQWGSQGSALLYSFEYLGNLSKGSYFLPGLALTDDTTTPDAIPQKGPAHGDELAYIFEPLNPNGKFMDNNVSSTDANVRDNFVSLISKFAHNTNQKDGKGSFDILGLSGLLPFSQGGNEQYLKIANGISVEKDFRFCQMGIWGNMGDRLAGDLCKNLIGNLLKGIPGLNNLPVGELPLTDLTNQASNNLLPPSNNLPVLGGVSNGLFGSGPKTTKAPSRNRPTERATTKRTGVFGLPIDF